MAHHRRKRARINTFSKAPRRLPSWWNMLFHTRPRRRKNRALEKAILSGKDAESTSWPIGGCRPHNYYW